MTVSSPGADDPGALFTEGAAKRFASDTARYLPAILLPSLFGMVAITIFTRTFDPLHYGLYSLALAVIGPPVDIVAETVGQPVGRYYAEYSQRDRLREFLHVAGFLSLMASALSLVIGVVVSAWIVLHPGNHPYLSLVAGAASLALAQVITATVVPILRSSLRPSSYRITTIVSSGLFVVLAVAFVQLFSHSVAWLLWAQTIASAVMLPYIYTHTHVPIGLTVLRLTPEMRATARRFVRYGVPMMLWFAAGNILHREDVYVIGWFRGSGEVGIYSVNYNLIFAMSGLITTPVLYAAGPILYQQWGSGKVHLAQDTITRMTELYMILGLLFVGGVIALGKPFVSLVLGSQFAVGASILIPVAGGRVLWGAANVGHKGLELSERPLTIAASALAASVLNLGLNLIFVPHYGYIAAAYVTFVSYGVYSALIWWQSRLHIPWRINFKNAWRYCIPTAAATGGALAICSLFPTHANLERLAVGAPVFLALYAASLFVLAGAHIKTLFIQPKEA